MKTLFVFLSVALFIAGIFSGCSDNIKQQNAALNAENAGLKNEVQLLQSQIADLKKNIQKLEAKQQDLETSQQKTIGLLEDKQRQTEISYKTYFEKLEAELAQAKTEAATLRTNSEIKVERKGRLKVNVTYKYNDFIGNRADVGATVILQPIDSKMPAYPGKVGGDGYAVINGITPGKYFCLISSVNVKSGGFVLQEDADRLKKFMPELSGFFLIQATICKIKTMFVNVSAGEETQISYDFGLSAL